MFNNRRLIIVNNGLVIIKENTKQLFKTMFKKVMTEKHSSYNFGGQKL